MECHVAGTSHIKLDDLEPNLYIGQTLAFEREPDNPVDPLAIRIATTEGRLIGYVPKKKKDIIARLMDAGKLVFGRLESKAWYGQWPKIDVMVFLKD